jgi:hypothetical protein
MVDSRIFLHLRAYLNPTVSRVIFTLYCRLWWSPNFFIISNFGTYTTVSEKISKKWHLSSIDISYQWLVQISEKLKIIWWIFKVEPGGENPAVEISNYKRFSRLSISNASKNCENVMTVSKEVSNIEEISIQRFEIKLILIIVLKYWLWNWLIVFWLLQIYLRVSGAN